MTNIDLNKVEEIIAEVARREIMPRFQKLAAHEIEMKAVNDPVTVADKATEIALSKSLTELLPGSVIVGEEGCAEDATLLTRFGGEDPIWVIDPIDGTRNFVEGKPEFGVMVALVKRKETLAAWIHDPNTGDTLKAEKGSGVWLGSEKLHLAGHNPSQPRAGVIAFRLKKILLEPEYKSVADDLPPVVAGSAAAFDYGRLFEGRSNFASKTSRVTFLLYRLSKPWDHVPGLFLLAEGGGYSANLLGHPYDYEDNKAGLLIASSKEEWGELQRTLKPLFRYLTPERFDLG